VSGVLGVFAAADALTGRSAATIAMAAARTAPRREVRPVTRSMWTPVRRAWSGSQAPTW
jgi:hypothetical protein